MNAYISNDLNMVKELDPQRHALALKMEEFLSHGGTIEVLRGPTFVPPPVRHEPPQTKKSKPVNRTVPETAYIDKITQRDIDREERNAQRAKDKAELMERIRKLAVTMTYAQAVEATGMPRRSLERIAVEGGFKFKPAIVNSRQPHLRGAASEEKHAKDAERIKAFKEIGLSRNQAINQLGVTFKTFNMLLAKFNIDYPKRRAGPHPAFFAKQG